MEQEILDNFIKAIKDTPEYKNYENQKEIVKKMPKLKEQLDDFRSRNYVLQHMPKSPDLLDKMDQFNKEYEDFTENPLVDDFLQAEVAFCRMMQSVNLKITEALEFE